MFPKKDVQCHSPHEPPLFAGDVCSAVSARELPSCCYFVTWDTQNHKSLHISFHGGKIIKCELFIVVK